VIAGALVEAGVLAACGETRGLLLGEAPLGDSAPPLADAAAAEGGSTPIVNDEMFTVQQGGPGGSPYVDICPGNQVVIGYQGFLTAPSVGLTLVGGIETVCGELAVGESSVALTTRPGAILPMRGGSRTSPWLQMCPADEVVVGFSGRSGLYLDQIAFECAPWVATEAGDDAEPSLGRMVTLTAAGGDSGGPFVVPCPDGQVARGSHVGAGDWVDAFGLICGSPTP
jgi:hypothetical protein